MQQGTSSTSQNTAVGEDFRFASQNGSGQLSGLAQTQPGNSEDFPPLERTTSDDVDLERRPRIAQQGGAIGAPGRADYGGSQGRNGVVGGQEGNSTTNASSSGDAIGGQGENK